MAAVQPIEQRTSRSFETEFATPDTVRPRLDSIDLLRGLVMILMALTIPATSSRMLTSTRPTCRRPPRRCFSPAGSPTSAPVFTFLAGAGAYLTAARGKTRPQLSWFLLIGGLWLIVLEYTVVWFCITFHFDWHFLPASMLWCSAGG